MKDAGKKLKILGGSAAARNRVLTVCLAAVIAVGGAAFGIIRSQSALAVYVGGEAIGTVRNEQEAAAVVHSVEQRASDILGYEYSMEDTVDYGTKLSEAGDPEELETALLETVDGIEMLYTIRVDGELVGAAREREIPENALRNILDKYTADGMISVTADNEVKISREYASTGKICGEKLLTALLDPENKSSECSLTVNCVAVERHDEELPFETVNVEDPEMFETLSEKTVTGVPGQVRISENVLYVNGVEQSRTESGRTVTVPAVDEVITVGTKPHALTDSWGTYIWPAEGIITSYFGYRSTDVGSSDHKGLDIAGSYRQDIVAADGGEVIMADWYYGYGYLIQILHDNGEITYYGHCDELLVTEGERVYQGQLIAFMGETGVASGVHLHFEIRVNDEPVDPLAYLPEL